MKTKILGVLVVAGIAVLTTLNVSLTGTENNTNYLTLDIAQQKASATDEIDIYCVYPEFPESDGWLGWDDFVWSFFSNEEQYENYQDPEWNQWSSWYNAGSKDEQAFLRPCPVTESNSGQTNPDRQEIKCVAGAANCKVVDC